jgi:hypothetical protein
MGLLDWMKRDGHAETLERHNAEPIREIWKSGAYVDRAAGYSVRACIGRSAEGYHPGLTVAQTHRKESTSWGEPCNTRRDAMGVAHNAFDSWIESHGGKQQEAVKRLPRPAPSWER